MARSGQPHVDADDGKSVLVEHALAVNLDDRELQALGIDVGGQAVEGAADVGPMRHAAGERHELTAWKIGTVKVM